MVIDITGPIASGKSTIAREAARELERRGTTAAVIDLDLIYEMLAGNGPKSDGAAWRLARRAAATLANAFNGEGVGVVIAEGSFDAEEHRAAFSENLRTELGPTYVTLRVSYEEALHRAQTDPTRGISRNPAFLGPYFAAVSERIGDTPCSDLVIDTERTTAAAAAVAIADLVGTRPAP